MSVIFLCSGRASVPRIHAVALSCRRYYLAQGTVVKRRRSAKSYSLTYMLQSSRC